MKSIKYMLIGIFIVVLAAWFAAIDGGHFTYLWIISLVLAPLGTLIFLRNCFRRDD